MEKVFSKSFLDYLYKFMCYSNLPIEREDLKEILLPRKIIIENKYSDYEMNYLSDEAYYFTNDKGKHDLLNSDLIQHYTNILIKRCNLIISNQMMIMIKHTFYYLFLDKGLVNPNGDLVPKTLAAKEANVLDNYIAFHFH